MPGFKHIPKKHQALIDRVHAMLQHARILAKHVINADGSVTLYFPDGSVLTLPLVPTTPGTGPGMTFEFGRLVFGEERQLIYDDKGKMLFAYHDAPQILQIPSGVFESGDVIKVVQLGGQIEFQVLNASEQNILSHIYTPGLYTIVSVTFLWRQAGNEVWGILDGTDSVISETIPPPPDPEEIDIDHPDIDPPDPLDPVSANFNVTDISEEGAEDGAITFFSPSGGSGDYEFSIDGTSWQISPNFTGLPAGFYNLWIRDEHNHTNINNIDTVEIEEPEGVIPDPDWYDLFTILWLADQGGVEGNYLVASRGSDILITSNDLTENYIHATSAATFSIMGDQMTVGDLIDVDHYPVLPVLYDNQEPHHIRGIGVLHPDVVDILNDPLHVDREDILNTLHENLNLYLYWSGEWNDFGVMKANRTVEMEQPTYLELPEWLNWNEISEVVDYFGFPYEGLYWDDEEEHFVIPPGFEEEEGVFFFVVDDVEIYIAYYEPGDGWQFYLEHYIAYYSPEGIIDGLPATGVFWQETNQRFIANYDIPDGRFEFTDDGQDRLCAIYTNENTYYVFYQFVSYFPEEGVSDISPDSVFFNHYGYTDNVFLVPFQPEAILSFTFEDDETIVAYYDEELGWQFESALLGLGLDTPIDLNTPILVS